MMTISSIEVVLYTAMFVLPGFIMNKIIDTLNPPRKVSESSFFLSCLGYSLINTAIWSWAYVLLYPISENENRANFYWIALLAVTVAGAIICSTVIGLIKQHRLIYRIAQNLKITVIDPTPTAWDFRLFTPSGSFVLVTLTDGKEVQGWFGGNSFASSDPQERDIFIEKVFLKSNDSETWVDNPENDGIYISKDMIKYIEFKKIGDDSSCQTTKIATNAE